MNKNITARKVLFLIIGLVSAGIAAYLLQYKQEPATAAITTPPSTISLANADATFNLSDPNAYAGYLIESIGDINDDGFNDVLFNPYEGDITSYIYIVFGSATKKSGNYELATDADVIISQNQDYEISLISTNYIGDVNGDQIDDLVFSSTFSNNQLGALYIYYGGAANWNPAMSTTDADITIVGENIGDGFGNIIEPMGDVDADGYNDFIIGAPNNSTYINQGGQIYLVYGGNNAYWSAHNGQSIANLADASIASYIDTDNIPYSLQANCDMNGDGKKDILFTNYSAQLFLLLSDENPRANWSMGMDYSNLIAESYSLPFSLANFNTGISCGHINNDNFDDFVISAEGFNSHGAVFVKYGHTNGWYTNFNANLSSLASISITNGVQNSVQMLGSALSAEGDLNGDGLDDIAYGAPNSSHFLSEISAAGVLMSSGANYQSSYIFDESDVILTDSYIHQYGTGVQIVNDMNGDGYDELIVNGAAYDTGTGYGINMLWYGGPSAYQITAPTGVDLEDSQGHSIELGASYGINSEDGADQVYVKSSTGQLIAIYTASLNMDVDWSGLTTGYDQSSYKAFTSGNSLPGANTAHTLLVPKAQTHTGVYICPNASSLNQISLSCSGGYLATESSANVSIITYQGGNYWQITDLQGTGGMSYTVTSSPPPTPTSCLQVGEQGLLTAGDTCCTGLTNTVIYSELDQCSVADADQFMCIDLSDNMCGIGENSCNNSTNCDVAQEPPVEDDQDDTPPIIPEVPTDNPDNPIWLSPATAKVVKEVIDNSTVALPIISGVLLSGFIGESLVAIPAVMMRFYNVLLILFKIRVKGKNFGLVYDAVTKSGISLAVIRFYNSANRLVKTEVTDSFGSFYSDITPGKYRITVKKYLYTFPSKIVTSTKDYPLESVYHGEEFGIKDQTDLILSIPLDPQSSIASKLFASKITYRLKNLIYNLMLYSLFGITAYSLVTFLFAPDSIKLFILIFNSIMLLLNIYFLNTKMYTIGVVRDQSNKPVKGVQLALVKKEFDEVIAKRYTDENGMFNFVVGKGEFEIKLVDPKYRLLTDARLLRVHNRNNKPTAFGRSIKVAYV